MNFELTDEQIALQEIVQPFANEQCAPRSRTGKAVKDMAMDVPGSYGYSSDDPIDRMLRDSRGLPLVGGTRQIQKILIASTVFGRRFDQRK